MLLVFGKTGQVARALTEQVPQATYLSRAEADLRDPPGCAAEIRRLAPSAVINAAAYTAVDRAESEPALAERINGEAPWAMAEACAALDIPFIQISSDYVFSGAGEAPWPPDAPAAPINAYGRSKLAGEQAVKAAGGRYVILRTSWVFSAQGHNFLNTMLKLSETRSQLAIVGDQVGGPTPAAPIAEACLRIVAAVAKQPALSGTYHFAGTPNASWAEFAAEIFRLAKRRVTIEAISSQAYPTAAARPGNSRLDCRLTRERFGLQMPDWRVALAEMLPALLDSKPENSTQENSSR